jgi:hypothetical protein
MSQVATSSVVWVTEILTEAKCSSCPLTDAVVSFDLPSECRIFRSYTYHVCFLVMKNSSSVWNVFTNILVGWMVVSVEQAVILEKMCYQGSLTLL